MADDLIETERNLDSLASSMDEARKHLSNP